MPSDTSVDVGDGDVRRNHGRGRGHGRVADAGGGDGPVLHQQRKHCTKDGTDDHGCSGERPVAEAAGDDGGDDCTPPVVPLGGMESERLT